MEAAITNFAALDAPNKFLILGDMLELGKDALTEHKRVVELIKKSGFKKVILTGNMFFQLKELSSFKYFRNRNESEEYIKTLYIESHTILIKASRGIGLEMLAKYF
jgi:UDP-N-acetylmuramoyl-tripeptide--D-alanyl-D-alanine ligase